MTDEQYMEYALNLAKKGEGHVAPNPMVGAVIVKNGRIIGEGYHEKYGEAHAEVNAIQRATEAVEGATIYVTLEPCAHYGKTPPCAQLLIDSKIKRVVIGCLDPNRLVGGQGVQMLKEAGLSVTVGVLQNECEKINEIFMHYITQKQPFVIMKTAMTLDGKIASVTGDSKWITGSKAREQVHKLRHRVSGIMVGIETVLVDNPFLSCRIPGGVHPIRLIVDSKLRVPLDANVLNNQEQQKTIVATTNLCDKNKQKALEEKGIEVVCFPHQEGQVNLKTWICWLGERKIDSILLEGGSTLNFSMLKEGLVHRIETYIAPKILGGNQAPTPVGGEGFKQMIDAIYLREMQVKTVGEDLWICAKVAGKGD
ncbi:MAG: bifunctional diaminohydroxyphosphoribosylaminopyrimidine deaminase/5-amino-6-(5-phosphoribosylamino)uracil reductase RibD [Bacillales bacterium]|nr:bifunctional diaminohydroxyphosphoribosylaminopyrimidine deaminase/5-amino-6-(5-phosphoribosylamino)uracil reductase RibD [Bacillales bacterium]